MSPRIRAALLCAAAFLMLAAGGCKGDRAGSAETPAPAPVPRIVHQAGHPDQMTLQPDQVPGVRMAEVREVELPAVLETTGQVTFNDRDVSTIVSRVQGRIEQTRVSLWDNVRRGEKIVALYSPDFMTAEAEYLQSKTTAKITGAPQMGVDGANLGEAMVTAARRKLELLGMDGADIAALKQPDPTVWMRAPIGGTVVENKALRGAAVSPGDVMFTLGTLSTVWITGDIYEDDLARVHLGQHLEAVTTAYPDQIFNGVIDRISPAIDPATHTLQIRCAVGNPGLKLKPQMLARIRIVTRPGKALVVAQDALIFETDAYYAFVQTSPGLVERRKVTIGSWSQSGYARVLSGLKLGDRVVTGETLQVNAIWHAAHGESS